MSLTIELQTISHRIIILIRTVQSSIKLSQVAFKSDQRPLGKKRTK